MPPTREEELAERVRKLEAQVAYLKNDCPEGSEALPNRDKALAVAELSGHGHAVRDLLEVAGLSRSSYYYALAHLQQPTRVRLRPKVAKIFSRTPNGCGHRQVAMCLRAEEGERIADKTVLKMMRQMGLRCGICRETNYHRYNSYKGTVGQSFKNIIGRNFTATGPWQKMGTDVTEFKLSFGKAYLAPVYDFAGKEIVAHSISMCPNLTQQQEMLQILMDAKPAGVEPILHSDMGWQYQHETYISTLAENGFIQSMSRKGNCIDNGATEQVFGHIKDEFFRGQDWQTFESFKADLDAVAHDDSTVFPDDGRAGSPGEHVDEGPHLAPGRGREGDAARVHLVEQLIHAGREVLVIVQEGAVHVDGSQAQVGARVTRGVSGGRHGSIVPDGKHGCSHRGRGWGNLTPPRAARAWSL